jgi:GWxTD domain-containing protein
MRLETLRAATSLTVLRACWILLGLGCIGAPAGSVAGVRSPLGGVGELEFVADMPVFPEKDGGWRTDLAVQIRHPELNFEVDTRGNWSTRVLVELKLAREGIVSVDTTQAFTVRAADADDVQAPTRFQLLEMSVPVEPGLWAATIRVREQSAGRADGTGPAGRASGVLQVPRLDAELVRLSDPEFRLRSPEGTLPHPERVFGVVQDTLDVYFELQGASPGQTYVVELEVEDPVNGGTDQQIVRLQAEREHVATIYRLPLGSFPEGAYVLRLLPAWSPGRSIEADFSISWRMERVVQEGRDVLTEATLVLDSADLKTFRRLSRPAQVQMMEEFWARHDPTPGTVRNEVYERFLARRGYAERFFGEFGTPGPLTDRGRIYIHYGPPAEVSVEVLPTNGDDLEEAIRSVHDTYSIEIQGKVARDFENKQSILGAPRPTRDDVAVAEDQLRNQARIGSEGSFELWSYRLNGDPLLPDLGTWSENLDLRFLFVDRLGSGVYRLDFSNLSTRY